MLQTLRQVQSGSGIGLKAGNGVLGVVVFKFPFLKKKNVDFYEVFIEFVTILFWFYVLVFWPPGI